MTSLEELYNKGLPWMENFVEESVDDKEHLKREVAKCILGKLNGKPVLLVLAMGGMMFKFEEAVIAQERFRGTREVE